jgi:serine/threonine protein kinase
MEQDPFIGREIGNYHILSLINSGAFGSVYKAEHLYLKERLCKRRSSFLLWNIVISCP